MRRSLWATVGFNLGGAFLFAFPSSPLGEIVGLPGAVPPIYSASLAFFVALFAGAYAWLARQPVIDRPLVGLSVVGKSGFFALMFLSWLLGEASGLWVIGATGDLVFAGIFVWWLLGDQQAAAA